MTKAKEKPKVKVHTQNRLLLSLLADEYGQDHPLLYRADFNGDGEHISPPVITVKGRSAVTIPISVPS